MADDEKREYEFHEIANVLPLVDQARLESLAADIEKQGLIHPIALFEGKILDGRNRYRACELIRSRGGKDYRRYRELTASDFGETGNPVWYVASENFHRRDLDTVDRARYALAFEQLAYERARIEHGKRISEGMRQPSAKDYIQGNVNLNGYTTETSVDSPPETYTPPPWSRSKREERTSTAIAGQACGTSASSVGRAKAVDTKGTPELKKAVFEDKIIGLGRGERLAQKSPDEQRKEVAAARSERKRKAAGKKTKKTNGTDKAPAMSFDDTLQLLIDEREVRRGAATVRLQPHGLDVERLVMICESPCIGSRLKVHLNGDGKIKVDVVHEQAEVLHKVRQLLLKCREKCSDTNYLEYRHDIVAKAINEAIELLSGF